jgi:hypothetical protein
MYIGQVIGYLSWPFMILVSYLAVRWALKVFEKKRAGEVSEEG